MQSLKIQKIGNSLGVILSPEIIHKLQLQEGDYILATVTANGIEIVASDAEFKLGMEVYHKVVSKYDVALRRISKMIRQQGFESKSLIKY